MLFHHRRLFSADTAPSLPEKPFEAPDPQNYGRTGYGELRGERRSMFGGPVEHADTFPKDITPLEKMNWHNHSLNDEFPNLVPSPEENRRIWQDIEVERLLDHHPTHEIHANDLPDYHFWPPIQNELEHKPKSRDCFIGDYTEDQTALPRFARTGVPKNPRQDQDYYIPLRQDGRFDFKENIRKNGYSASLFSKKGWAQRYHVAVNRPMLYFHLSGFRNLAQLPIHFRHAELPVFKRLVRHISGSCFDRHAMFVFFYLGGLLYFSSLGKHWRYLNWNNDPWNYDMAFNMTYRSKGGYHGAI